MQGDHEPRSGFFDQTVGRPVAMLVIFATLIVVGLIAYSRVPLTMLPSGISHPGLEINVANPGSSAAENEEKIARIIEEQVRTLSGIDTIYSGSFDDGAWIYVRYESDTDMDVAKAELRDRVERVRPQLPETVEEVFIWSSSEDQMPILFFALLHPGDSERTDYLVENVIQRRIEAVDGAGRVEMWGLLDPSVEILLDEDRVMEARLDLGQLIRRLAGDNFAIPLGEIDDGGRHYLLRSDMRFRSIAEIENYPVGNGLRIKDLGRVGKFKSVRNYLSRIDGAQAYYGEIQAESQANVVATSHRLQAKLDELQNDPQLAGEFEFRVLFSQGEFIEASLAQLRATALWGGALAIGILFVFLRRVRLTLCVALSIPVSSLLAVAWVFFTGGTLNILTMAGITLGIGMLVDNSVVVVENVARLKALGLSGRRAAVAGTRDVAMAVTLATLTTVVVFLPLVFMTEHPVMRVMFGALGIPLCVSVLFSLLAALVFLPVIAARTVGPRATLVERAAALIAPVGALPYRAFANLLGALRFGGFLLLAGLHRLQRGLLAVLVPLRWPLVLSILALAVWKGREVAGTFGVGESLSDFNLTPPGMRDGAVANSIKTFALPALFATALVLFGLRRWRRRPAASPLRPRNFVPRSCSFIDLLVDANRGMVRWALQHRLLASLLAVGTIASIQVPAGNMQVAAFGEDENLGRLDMRVTFERSFTLPEADEAMKIYEEHLEGYRQQFEYDALVTGIGARWGRLTLYWKQNRSQDRMAEIRKTVRDNLPKLAGHQIRMRGDNNERGSNLRSVVRFEIKGPDYDELLELGRTAMLLLADVPGLYDLSSPAFEASAEQVRVVLDNELASSFGVTADTALQNISWALRGFTLPRYQEAGQEIPFYISYDNEKVAGLDTLRDLPVYTAQDVVPLTSFARIEFAPGTRRIFRRNGQATLTIEGRVDNPSLQGRVSALGYAVLRNMELPRGYSLGDDESPRRRQEEEIRELQIAALFGLVLVFILMGILFESFILPFSVLATIPFAVVGSYWTLYITGTTMDSVGWIGIVILVGVVVNNGIVLIDRVHRLRSKGQERDQAVLDGASHRVRPILMTAMTTVGGLLPMALSEANSNGIDYRALATCVSGGLALSTSFTIWVVPLAYTLMDDLGAAIARRAGWFLRLPAAGLSKLRSRREPALTD